MLILKEETVNRTYQPTKTKNKFLSKCSFYQKIYFWGGGGGGGDIFIWFSNTYTVDIYPRLVCSHTITQKKIAADFHITQSRVGGAECRQST